MDVLFLLGVDVEITDSSIIYNYMQIYIQDTYYVLLIGGYY